MFYYVSAVESPWARLNEHELARQRLTAALELRERLGHIEETRRALELLRSQ